MKKLIALLVAGITVSAFMVGCNKPAEGDNANTPATTSTTTGKAGAPVDGGAPTNPGATSGSNGAPGAPPLPGGGTTAATAGTTGK